jgi:hypothetical protein
MSVHVYVDCVFSDNYRSNGWIFMEHDLCAAKETFVLLFTSRPRSS